MSLRIFVIGFAIVLLASCTTIETETVPVNANAAGFTYSVPLRLAELELTRTIAPVTNIKELSDKYYAAYAAHKTASDLYNSASSVSEKADRIAELARQAPDLSAEDRSKAIASAQDALAAKELAKAALDNAKQRMDTLRTALESATSEKPDDKKWKFEEPVDKLTFKLLPVVADPNYRFSARFPHYPLRHDIHKVIVNEKGLLQSAELESADKSGEVAVLVASAVAAFGVGISPAPLPDFDFGQLGLDDIGDERDALAALIAELLKEISVLNRQLAPPDFSTNCGESGMGTDGKMPWWSSDAQSVVGTVSHKVILDPTDPVKIGEFNKTACTLGFNLRITVDSLIRDPGRSCAASQATTVDSPGFCPIDPGTMEMGKSAPGLIYKRLRSFRFSTSELRKDINGEVRDVFVDSVLAEIPNASPLDVVTDHSSLFVTNKSGMKFVDGTLTELSIDRPSEVHQAAKAIVAVAKAPFEIVSEVVKLSVDTAGGQKAIAEAALGIEKMRSEQELALATKQLELDKLQVEQGVSVSETLLKSEIELERMNSTRDVNLALELLKKQSEITQGLSTQEAALLETEIKKRQLRNQLLDELLEEDVFALTRDTALSDAELDAALRVLRKRKEILMLQKEIDEIEN